MDTINFRVQIRTLLERKKISVAKLSRTVDIHQDTIYRFLREETEMSSAGIEKILNILNAMDDTRA